MVPKINRKGRSFQGCARYLLHDIGASTADRVAWTEVRNVSTRNPEAAWRVMAFTSMDQARLKAEAGVKNTGRKSKDHVLHFSLSWSAEEAPTLNKAEMMRAASTILQVMNALDHQAMIICHTDRPQPHVHVLVNRVNPKDGRLLSSSFEKLNASRWAQRYEEERGKIYCTERVLNNAARERDEFTRGKKNTPRHLHEVSAAPANDNDRKQRLLDEHRRKAAELKQAERLQKERHAKAWMLLAGDHKRRKANLAKSLKQELARKRSEIRDRLRPEWEYQHHEHQAQLRAFEQREAGAVGRIRNALRSIDFASLIGRNSAADDGRVKTIAEAFRVVGSAGARLRALKKQQEAARRELQRRQRRLEVEAIAHSRFAAATQRQHCRLRFEAERSSLILQHTMERTKLKAQWRQKGRQMREEWKHIRQIELTEPIKNVPKDRRAAVDDRPTPAFTAAAGAAEQAKANATSKSPVPAPPTRTNPSDLVPQQGAAEAAKQIDQWEEMWARRGTRRWDHERGRGDGRDR